MDEQQQIVSPIVKILLHKLQSLHKQNVTLGREGINNIELGRLETILSSFRAVLLDAEKQQLHNNDVRGWLKKLKDACYDAEDALDELEMEQSRSITGKVCDYISCSKSPANLRFTIDNEKIKEIKERLDAIKVDVSKFSFQDRVHHDNGNVPRERETIAHLYFVVTSDVFGRYADKENIIDLLIPDELHRKIHIWKEIRNVSVDGNIIHIFGPSGIGKTTLAKMVYKDKRIDESFDIKMWVCLSQHKYFQMKMIIDMIYYVTGRIENNMEIDELQKVLQNILSGKKYLLVLDEFDSKLSKYWTKLESLLSVGAKESKTIIITNSAFEEGESIPRKLYPLGGISYHSSLSLFMRCVFKEGNEEKPYLIKVGEEIAAKCAGLPLVVKLLGSILHFSID
ncbi:hypothetical protein Dsin_014294 [Dipteronia sinensis]|uniref:Uncharacterized protein n=1 Tax=Dipteronia sinensis TaxID=43782 RepID=A0AAE0AMS6_9ROSI|nr:hypothetical protein Dsin_014294 [Dipteronia sinensis]